jgi:hypothetical protein
MTSRHLSDLLPSGLLRYFAAVLIAYGLGCPALLAQELALNAPQPSDAMAAPIIVQAPQAPAITTEHRFWDRENIVLFTASAALSAADFTVTRQNLQSGGRELNPIVRVFGRSTAGLAVNFAGETAGEITLGYIFHRTGHHRLERIVSLVNISTSAGAVTYGLTHR